jgi:hypothetical protein
MATHSLRFDDPVLHQSFVRGVQQSGARYRIGFLGAVECDDEAWAQINSVAHAVRDGCFRWYSVWWKTAAESEAFLVQLRASNLPFQLEHHEGRYVFLLAREHRAAYEDLFAEIATGDDA